MALSAYQLWQHKRKGKRYCQAWILRDNEVIGVVNEPFNTIKFEWEDGVYIRKDTPDIIWGGRDVFIYEFDDVLGKVLTVKNALDMEEKKRAEILAKKEKESKKEQNNHEGEYDIVLGITKVSPRKISKILGEKIIEEAISGMREKKSSINIAGIIMMVIVLVMVVFVFLR